MSMKVKEVLVRKFAFPKLPTSKNMKPVITFGIAYKKMTEKVIEKTLMTQSTSKAPRLDKFNFCILCIV